MSFHGRQKISRNFRLSLLSDLASYKQNHSSCGITPKINTAKNTNSKIQESFQFKDQFVNKKGPARNLHKSCQDYDAQFKKVRRNRWTEQKCSEEKQQKIAVLQNIIQQLSKAKLERKKSLKNCFNVNVHTKTKNKYETQPNQQTKIAKLFKKKPKNQLNQTQKTLEFYRDLHEKVLKQNKLIKRMKKQILQLNIQQFRNYCRQEHFDGQDKDMLNLLSSIKGYDKIQKSKLIIFKSNNQSQAKQRQIFIKQIRKNIAKQCDRKFLQISKQLDHLVYMKMRYQTQYNWQKSKPDD